MKTFTSASAAKHLKALQDEKDHILALEKAACTYTLAAGEEAEPPEYDYEATRCTCSTQPRCCRRAASPSTRR